MKSFVRSSFVSRNYLTRIKISPAGILTANFSSSSDRNIRSLLSQPNIFHEANLIGENWRKIETGAKNSIPVKNPSTGKFIGNIPAITELELNACIEKSHHAQIAWARSTSHSRGEILKKWFELIKHHERDIGIIMSAEQGKPLKEAIGEVQYAAGFLDVYSNEASRQFGEIIPSPSSTSRILVSYQPVGVVGAITPWNFPAAMITRKVGAAIAAGCSVVLKPSELTPFTAFALADLALQAGLPAGVLQMVTGDAAMIGKVLTSHPIIRKIAFTGSTKIGKLLISQSAASVKRTSMELGGNAPFIVFKDANISTAVDGIFANKFRNCGQTCVTANRIFVHSEIYEEVAKKLTEKVKNIKVGDGLTEGVTAGPLINKQAIKKVEDHVRDALEKGGKLLTGGRRLNHEDCKEIPVDNAGLFYSPTVITEANNSMAAFDEETFGPIAFLYKFDEEEKVLSAANSTSAGLAAYIYTTNIGLISRSLDSLNFGMIGVNQPSVSVPTAPFGGMKESGYGREGSHHGLKDYLEMKTFHIAV